MSKAENLMQEAARAERLARSVSDALTVERLQAYAADCRKKAVGQPEFEAAQAAVLAF